eukprot:1161274-Pelagomonas_calceolata.AAC.7
MEAASTLAHRAAQVRKGQAASTLAHRAAQVRKGQAASTLAHRAAQVRKGQAACWAQVTTSAEQVHGAKQGQRGIERALLHRL